MYPQLHLKVNFTLAAHHQISGEEGGQFFCTVFFFTSFWAARFFFFWPMLGLHDFFHSHSLNFKTMTAIFWAINTKEKTQRLKISTENIHYNKKVMYDTKSVSMLTILPVRCRWRVIQRAIYTQCGNSKPFNLDLMKHPA